MAEIERLYVRVLGDIQDLEKKMSTAERRVFRFGDQMRSVGRGLTLGLTAPLVALGGVSVSAAADLDRLQRGLRAVAGSAGEADAQLRRLRQVARAPGLGFREAIQGSIRLQAAFGDMVGRAELAETTLRAFGNAIATVGGGKAQLDRVTLALSQIAAMGRVSGEEIRQLQEAVPQIRQAMLAAFGTADTEALQRRDIGAVEFIRAINAELLKLPQVTGGAANAFENFTDALFRARAAAGRAMLPAVTELTNGFAAMLEQVDGLDPRMVRLGIAFGAALAVAGPLTIAIGGLVTAVTALTVAGASLTAAILGPAAIIGGLSLLAGWFVKNKLEAAAAREEIDRFRESVRSSSDSMRDRLGVLQGERARIFGRISALRGSARTAREAGSTTLAESLERTANQLAARLGPILTEIGQLEAALAAGGDAAEKLGAKASAALAPLALTADTFDRLREAEARAVEELRDLSIERALAAGTEEAERLNAQFAEATARLGAIRSQLARFPSDASALTPQPGMAQSVQPGFRAPITRGPVQAIGGQALQWAVDTLAEALRRGEWIEDLPEEIRKAIRKVVEGTDLEAMLPPEKKSLGLGDVGAALTGVGGMVGGRAGGFLSGAGSAINAFLSASNPIVGAFGAMGGAVTALKAVLDDGPSKIDRMREALARTLDWIGTKFDLLDTPAIQQFEELKRLLADNLSGPLADMLATTTPENVRAFIEAATGQMDEFRRRIEEAMKIDRLIDRAKALEAIQRDWEAIFGAIGMDQLSDILRGLKVVLDDTGAAVGEALRNIPSGFKVALARFRATTPVGGPVPGGPGGVPPGGPHGERPTAPVTIGDVTIVIPDARDPRETARRVAEEFERMASRGGRAALRPALQGV